MSDRVLSISSLLFASAVVVVHNLVLAPWMLDDAFIFFRYAENWVAGHGLVFNPGEPPVEGFTSFLWLSLLAAANSLGVDLVVAALGLGHLVVFATLWLVNQSFRWVASVDRRSAASATLLLGTSSVFTTWARAGMETGLQALLVAGLMLAYLRVKERPRGLGEFVGIGILCTLLGMNRPDGLVLVAVFAVDALLHRRRIGGLGVATTAVVFAVVFGGYFAWRWSYFGYPFPNTFYAKVGATGSQVVRGLGYLVDAAKTLAPLLLLLPVMGAAAWRANRNGLVLLALIFVYTGYIVAVGGDVMPAFRFFTPILPVLCLLAAWSLASLRVRWRWAGLLATMVYGLVVMFGPNVTTVRGDVVAFNGRIAGEWLREHAPAGSTIATNTAGTVVYYSKLRAIDMLGLNDLHIARVEMPGMGQGHAGHEKGDGDYVLAQNPEFIQLGSSVGWVPTQYEAEPPFPGGRQLWRNPRFREGYKLVYDKGGTLWPDGRLIGFFGFYVRNDLYDQMPKAK